MTISATAQIPSDDDQKFLATAAQSDVNEIKLSELADQKATNPAVKAFAAKMVSEHKKMSAGVVHCLIVAHGARRGNGL